MSNAHVWAYTGKMKTYLPGLNTIRFYAALSVVVVHALANGLNPLFLGPAEAVTLFFTLSGYLIVYRLLLERKQRGYIDLRAFYLRRELRILPLYYLILFLGAVVLPWFGAPPVSSEGFGYAFVLLPQVPHALTNFTALGTVGHLWSIGVEEIFYLTFPVLMRRLPLVKLCITVIVVCLLLRFLSFYGASGEVHQLFVFMRFDCMAVGALGAWLVFSQSRWLRVVYHPAIQATAWFVAAVVIVTDLALPQHDLFISIVFAVILLNISSNARSLAHLEYRWSKAAGDLTYGIYIWHLPLLWIVSQLVSGWAILLVTVSLTLVVARLSYQYVEKPLLQWKDRVGQWAPAN